MARLIKSAGLGTGLGLCRKLVGSLVDAKCFAARARNVDHSETLAASRDIGSDIRYGSVNAKTKAFGVTQNDGSSLESDPSGSQKAAELIQATGKKSMSVVTVSGTATQNTVKVNSISLANKPCHGCGCLSISKPGSPAPTQAIRFKKFLVSLCSAWR